MSLTDFDQAVRFLREEVAPQANKIDVSTAALRTAFAGLRDRNLLQLRRPRSLGGPEWPDADFRAFQLEIARASGTLAFLQTQQQRAAGMISKMAPAERARRLLDQSVGIAFSQLRKAGVPLTTAHEVEGGVVFNGQLPWMTGLGFFDRLLLGGILPDGRTVLAVADFKKSPHLDFGEPMELGAMGTALTVAGIATELFVPSEDIVGIEPEGWIHAHDQLNITLQGYFAMGNALASFDLLGEHAALFRPTWERILAAIQDSTLETAARLEVRAQAIDLMGRAAHAAIIASGGRGIRTSHSAQRVYREAMVFSVSALTPEIQEATLRTLACANKT